MDFSVILHEYLLPSAWTAFVTVVGALFAFIGTQLKKKYQEKVDTEEKKHAVETCVKAAEMIYKDLKGDEKLKKVKADIVEWLNLKGLSISEIELNMMIEAAVTNLNINFIRTEKEIKAYGILASEEVVSKEE